MKLKHILFALTLCFVTMCGSKTAPEPTPRTPVSATNTPIISAEAGDQPHAAKSRTLLVLLDSSQSYELYEKAIRKLLSIVGALGPGDQLIIAQVAGRFQPETNIRLQAKFPDTPPDLLIPCRRLVECRQKQARWDALWQQVERRKREVTAYVTQFLVGKNNSAVTDLQGALAYSAQRFHQEPASEKYLILLSDLEHDFEKHKTFQPPAHQMNFASVYVRLLYIPWSDNWDNQHREWAIWFKRSGVSDFLMLDAGRSEQEQVIPPATKMPLASPFK